MLSLKDKLDANVTHADSASKVDRAITIQGNGTTIASYDGSSAKTVNITKSSIGLGSVDNTADSAKSVKYATSAGSASSATNATNAATASKVANAITLQTNGTTAAIFDGSSAKTVNITKASIGLGSVDNTSDSTKTVKAATKLQTYKEGSTTETYGDDYPLYAQWTDGSTVSLKCGDYKTKVDKASSADSASSASSATTASKLGSATVGSASTPIYLNGGTATACSGVMKAPIYSTTDLTPGVSDLADGQIYVVYYN